MTWDELDWEVLDRLREDFLSGAAGRGPYWHTLTDLECYDFTFGERIGWKWDAVLRELKLRGWKPGGGGEPAPIDGARDRTAPAASGGPGRATGGEPGRTTCGEHGRTILDWGCGSGIAGRRVMGYLGATSPGQLLVHDRSALAMDYAVHHGRKTFPHLAVERASVRYLRGTEPIEVLVISHVLNELDDLACAELADLGARARTILWVEPGTHEVSRALGSWRERWREQFRIIAPCPHPAGCGILAPGNARHWCHFFAAPPVGIYADSHWVKFGQRAGIDLRSLPYSFLVLERQHVATGGAVVGPALAAGSLPRSSRPADEPIRQAQGPELVEGRRPYKGIEESDGPLARIVGAPRHYKGFAKIFGCEESGASELILQKRDAPAVFKSLKRADGPLVYRWTRDGDRINSIVPQFE